MEFLEKIYDDYSEAEDHKTKTVEKESSYFSWKNTVKSIILVGLKYIYIYIIYLIKLSIFIRWILSIAWQLRKKSHVALLVQLLDSMYGK